MFEAVNGDELLFVRPVHTKKPWTSTCMLRVAATDRAALARSIAIPEPVPPPVPASITTLIVLSRGSPDASVDSAAAASR